MAIITGTTGDDVNLTRLVGTSDADTMLGLAGFDEIVGGGGNDLLIGGADGDALYGGDGVDTASYADATAGVAADLSGGEPGSGDAAGDSYASVENLTGSSHDDVLRGDAQSNVVRGGRGLDFLSGSGGDDRLEGGRGADLLVGDFGAADGGKDELLGGAGNDVLVGRIDRDGMAGGAGADSFLFYNLTDSGVTGGARDLITDFSQGQGDKINFFQDLDDFEFIGQAAFDAPGQIRFRHVDGNTRISLNADADSAAEMQIDLVGQINLTTDDFAIIIPS